MIVMTISEIRKREWMRYYWGKGWRKQRNLDSRSSINAARLEYKLKPLPMHCEVWFTTQFKECSVTLSYMHIGRHVINVSVNGHDTKSIQVIMQNKESWRFRSSGRLLNVKLWSHSPAMLFVFIMRCFLFEEQFWLIYYCHVEDKFVRRGHAFQEILGRRHKEVS